MFLPCIEVPGSSSWIEEYALITGYFELKSMTCWYQTERRFVAPIWSWLHLIRMFLLGLMKLFRNSL